MSGRPGHKRIVAAREALLLICIGQVGAEASNDDLSLYSGLTMPRVNETLSRLEAGGKIRRETRGGRRRIEVIERKRAPRVRIEPERNRLAEAAGVDPRVRMRSCLSCGTLFKSEHAGIRRCDKCKRALATSENPFEG